MGSAQTVYLDNSQNQRDAAFVVYHRDSGPDASVWMLPGTFIEQRKPYRSAILAGARPLTAQERRAIGPR